MVTECSNSATGVVPRRHQKEARFAILKAPNNKESSMSQRVRNRLIELSMLLVLGLAAAMLMPRANAGMIATDAAQAAAQPADERGRVKAMLAARPEVAQELQKLGIAPGNAAARVDAMTDEEVRTLAGRLDALPAGGAISNEQLLLIVIIVLLVIIIL
jgi:hypothetical protein